MAALNGVCSTNFAVDMGFSFKRVIQLEDAALRDLAACGGLTDIQLEELISWTGRGIGDVRMIFRGEVFVSRALRKPIIRGCPFCLREDIETDSARPLTQMAMRGDWQMREASLCITHRHPLVQLWEHRRPEDRYDFPSRFTGILEDIKDGRLERPRVTPSPYDLWLNARLETGADDTWLAGQSLYAATTFCTLLGSELLRLKDPTGLDVAVHRQLAQATGFEIAHRGKAAIRDALTELAALADGSNDTPSKAFGRLFGNLSQINLSRDDFAQFRQILRDCIVDIWPVAAGESVLGIIQPERQLHSVVTAAREANIGSALLEQFLVDAGAIGADDDRPTSRKTFNATAYADLLAEVPTLVGPTEMQRVMGATQGQLMSLAEDGVLAPRINIPTINSPWRPTDGIALIAELQELSVPIESSDKRWEGIQQAKKRSGVRVGAIITSLREGKLQLGRRTDLEGYAGFCVLMEEIDQMSRQKQDPAELTFLTAAVFGRSVGMRTQGWFERLAAAGHTPATRRPHPKWGGDRVYVSPCDINDFHNRFLTSTTMETEFGQHRRTLLAKLKTAKVKPFMPNGESFGALFLREEVETALR
jgi:TniQ